jgi:hypothetical protein
VDEYVSDEENFQRTTKHINRAFKKYCTQQELSGITPHPEKHLTS